MTLPAITRRQKDILNLLYRHRFLNRIQIQALMGHKDKRRILAWLKDLREKEYVEWIYSTDFIEKTKPAIYYLSLNGIRHLKTVETHPIEELRKRYREPSRSQTFIDHSILVADCCIELEGKRTDDFHYYYETQSDYVEDSYFHFITECELIYPSLCFSRQVYDYGIHEDIAVDTYFLEIFDPTLPRYRMKKRLSNYIEYLDDNEWEGETDNNKLPIVLLVCPMTTDLIYAKRRTRGLMSDIWELNDEDRPLIKFTTIAKIKEHGVISKIWEKA